MNSLDTRVPQQSQECTEYTGDQDVYENDEGDDSAELLDDNSEGEIGNMFMFETLDDEGDPWETLDPWMVAQGRKRSKLVQGKGIQNQLCTMCAHLTPL